METIAIYGKGGSGKSMVASNLSVQFAKLGLRTLQIGCDPKHDSTLLLTSGESLKTVISLLEDNRELLPSLDEFVYEGTHGIHCIEAGGPEPGVGCAGRGIVTAFQVIERNRFLDNFDAVVLDVLGDVVCGGFAQPLMKGFAGRVAILVSDNLMSMYAANNVAKAVRRFERNGAYLAGLIANNVHDKKELPKLEAFAERINTRLLASIPNDRAILEAERLYQTVSEYEPEGDSARRFKELCEKILNIDKNRCPTPDPMDDEERKSFFRSLDQ